MGVLREGVRVSGAVPGTLGGCVSDTRGRARDTRGCARDTRGCGHPASDPPPPHYGGHPTTRAPLCSRSRWDGETAAGRESWRGFLELLFVSSNSPSSLLTPLTLTPKLPHAGPKSHRPPELFPGRFFPGTSRLSRETPVAVRVGGGSLRIPELGEIPRLPPNPQLGPAPPRQIHEEF